MALLILCDPRYRNNEWCETKLRGIYDEAARRRISVKLYTNLDLFITAASKLDSDSSVIVLFNSFTYLEKVSVALAPLSIHPILSVTESDITFSRAFSQVCGDVDSATKELVEFLRANGKRRIALIGSSENSAAGRNKEKMLLRHVSESNCTIFRNKGNLLESFNEFLELRKNFDTVICIDDYQAVSFIEFLQSKNAYDPSLYIISHGDTAISELYGDGISTVSTSFYACGRAMVEAHIHRLKYNWSTVMIRVHCDFKARGSTSGNAEYPLASAESSCPNLLLIGRLESLLKGSDLVNLKLMYGLLCEYSYERMSDMCFLSSGAVKYRLLQMRRALGCKNREETALCIGRYIQKEKLLEAIEKAEGIGGKVFN
ncbi:MAG: hypothetical protein IJC81_06245 [Clostridia bacterium]|nr:hypothetical protein [Clostridia bacterium]